MARGEIGDTYRLSWSGEQARCVAAGVLGLRPMPVRSLWIAGKLPDGGPRIGVVGSRSADPPQLAATAELVTGLAEGGATIVSGGALGVDGAAPRAALQRGAATVVALPSGLDAPSPKRHLGLFAAVLAGGGALISREAPGFRFNRGAYRRRNAVVAAMVDALVVVCAAPRSGTMITAGMAARAGVPLYVVPWGPGLPNADGGHGLLAAGATPIRGVAGGRALAAAPRVASRCAPRLHTDDGNGAIDEPAGGWQRYAPPTPGERRPLTASPDGDPALVAAIDGALAERPGAGLSIEELVVRTARPRPQLAAAVLNLLMEGQLQRAPFGRYVRSP